MLWQYFCSILILCNKLHSSIYTRGSKHLYFLLSLSILQRPNNLQMCSLMSNITSSILQSSDYYWKKMWFKLSHRPISRWSHLFLCKFMSSQSTYFCWFVNRKLHICMLIRILCTQIIKNLPIKMSRCIVGRSFVKNLCKKMSKWNRHVWRQHIGNSTMRRFL